MTEHVKKVMIIGLDAPLTATVYNYAKEGKLPNIKKLIEEGVYAKNCLVPRARLVGLTPNASVMRIFGVRTMVLCPQLVLDG